MEYPRTLSPVPLAVTPYGVGAAESGRCVSRPPTLVRLVVPCPVPRNSSNPEVVMASSCIPSKKDAALALASEMCFARADVVVNELESDSLLEPGTFATAGTRKLRQTPRCTTGYDPCSMLTRISLTVTDHFRNSETSRFKSETVFAYTLASFCAFDFKASVSPRASLRKLSYLSVICFARSPVAYSSASYALLPSARVFLSTSSSCFANLPSLAPVKSVSKSLAPLAPPPALPTAA